MQGELEPGVALVEFALGDEKAWAVVTTKDGSALVSLGSAKEITQQAEELAKAMADDDLWATSAQLRELGAKILDPVLARLPREQFPTLLFAPHGALCRIPFELLRLRKGLPMRTWSAYVLWDAETGTR